MLHSAQSAPRPHATYAFQIAHSPDTSLLRAHLHGARRRDRGLSSRDAHAAQDAMAPQVVARAELVAQLIAPVMTQITIVPKATHPPPQAPLSWAVSAVRAPVFARSDATPNAPSTNTQHAPDTLPIATQSLRYTPARPPLPPLRAPRLARLVGLRSSNRDHSPTAIEHPIQLPIQIASSHHRTSTGSNEQRRSNVIPRRFETSWRSTQPHQ
jgi:hypothetical protein